jgi:thiamine pyrophosphokinase
MDRRQARHRPRNLIRVMPAEGLGNMAAPSASDTVVVVAGGEPLDPARPPALPEGALVVAADSGIDQAHALGLRVDVAVGDFDSVTVAGLARAADAGARLDRHPAAKDATDLELALVAAVALRPRQIHVIGGSGGRFDHLLANALLLAAPALAGTDVTAELGGARVAVVRHRVQLTGRPGDLLSLLAVHGPATGITTTGLEFPLVAGTLLAGSSRGVSNRFLAEVATVGVASGVLLAIQPGPEEPTS